MTGNFDVGKVTQSLVYNAISFRQPKQCRDLFVARVSIEIEMQSNFLKTHRDVFGNAERPAKIKIAFRANGDVA
jgi:hypothetical protein